MFSNLAHLENLNKIPVQDKKIISTLLSSMLPWGKVVRENI